MGCGTIILLVIVGWMVSCVALLYLAAFYIKYPVRTIIVSIILVLAVVFFVVKRELSKYNKIKELRVQEGTDRLHAMEILQNNAQAVAFIPKNYRFPLATGYMREMYESGRVRNMNEALDKYDEYEHRLKMEMSQSAILEQMEFQQSQISGASAAATVGAAASVINLLTSL